MEILSGLLTHRFPVSGVEVNVFLPPLVAFVISFFTSLAGLSGAFLLMPFQVSVLNYATPSASGTNLVYNIVAIPGGVYRFFIEGRMLWPLSAVVISGTVPGSLAGFYARAYLLNDADLFRLFSGLVLLYISWRTASDIFVKRASVLPGRDTEPVSDFSHVLSIRSADIHSVRFDFQGRSYSFSVPGLAAVSFCVGIVGGAYGVGGGAIIAPFCMAIYGLPVYAVAGAALFSTFITSIAGALFYAAAPVSQGISTSPDLALGALFGAGGFLGIYFGARCQKHIPERPIKTLIFIVLAVTGAAYVAGYFV
ncbi:MAG: sulfite exporter TauE/SafE family protein [Nitrospiraceae bacterium]|nr:sulfite exporter TauE/SafE family protein [Nitrospiraceae bacterium]